MSVVFTNADVGYVAGMDGTILKTIDGGATWSLQNSNTNIGLLSICFPNDTVGFATGGYGILLKTINGGATWSKIVSGTGTLTISSVCFTNANTGYIVCDWGYIYNTLDGGDTWASSSNNITQHDLNAVYFIDVDNGYAIGYNGTILRTYNGGIILDQKVNQIEEQFSLYPNPARNKISITRQLNTFCETNVYIFNLQGKRIISAKFQNQERIDIDISNLSRGMYLVELQNKFGISTKKLVIQ